MGYYLQIDADDPVRVASLSGWKEARTWIEGLSVATAPAIRHLAEHGWTEDVSELQSELHSALSAHPPPDEQNNHTLRNFFSLLKNHRRPITVVSVTDGVGQDDSEEHTESVSKPALQLTESVIATIALADLPEPPLGLTHANILTAMNGHPETDVSAMVKAHGGTSGNALSHIIGMSEDGLIKPTSPPVAGKPAKYAVTPLGEQKLADHEALKTQVLSHLQQNGLSQYLSIKDAVSRKPAVAIAHLLKEGHIQGGGTQGWQISPQGQKHLAQATGNGMPFPEPKHETQSVNPEILHPAIAGLLSHLAASGPQTHSELQKAGVTSDNADGVAYENGHMATVAKGKNGWAAYDLTQQGKDALAGHQAALKQAQEQAPEPAQETPQGTAAPSVPDGLTPGQAAIYSHVHANPGADYDDIIKAHQRAVGTSFGTTAALKGLLSAGHIVSKDDHGEVSQDIYPSINNTYHPPIPQSAAPAVTPSGPSSSPTPSGGYVTLPTGKVPLNGRKTSLPATEADIAPMVREMNAHPNAKALLSHVVQDGNPYADPSVDPHMTKGQLAATLAIADAHKQAEGHNKLLVGHVKAALSSGAGIGTAGGDLAAFKSAKPDIAAHLADHEEPSSPQGKPRELSPELLPELSADELFGKTEEHDGSSEEPTAHPLPEGWKPISTKADKGYKLSVPPTTAFVKPVEDGKYQLATTDGRDVNLHPQTFGSKEDAFAEAHKQLGVTPSDGQEAAGQNQNQGDEWDGKSVPPGWEDHTDTNGSPFDEEYHFPTGENTGAKVTKYSTGMYHAESPMQEIDNPFEDAPERWFQDKHKALKWAQAQAGGATGDDHLAQQEPETGSETTSPAVPAASAAPKLAAQPSTGDDVPASSEDVQAAIAGANIHPNAKAILTKSGLTKDQLSAVVAKAIENKKAALHPKLLPSHVNAAMKSILGGGDDPTQSKPEPAAPAGWGAGEGRGNDAALPNAEDQPKPEPSQPESKFVTVGGQKTPLSDDPATNTLVNKAAEGLSAKAKATLLDAHATGKIKTAGHLAETMAMAEAVNHGSGFKSITNFSLAKALAHGSVAGMKAAAEGGDAEAQKHIENLGETNVMGPKEQAKADFQNLSAEQLMHEKVGDQAGSNPGGFFNTSAGDSVYVKQPKDADQAHSEHLANQIYHALNLPAPQSTVATGKDGKAVYASQLMENSGTLGSKKLTPELAHHALQSAIADTLTANWDAAGQNHDNLLVSKDGKSTMHVDNGGSLLYRAQGGMKDPKYLPGIREWDNYSDPAKNASYAKLFKAADVGSMDELPGVSKQIQAVESVQAKHGGWANFIAKNAPGLSPDAQVKTADMLTKRTEALKAKRIELQQAQGGLMDRPYAMQPYDALKAHAKTVHAQSISADETKGISAFKGSPYHEINAALRGDGLDSASPTVKTHVNNLDKLFARPESTLAKDMIVSRKVTAHAHDSLTEQIANVQPGDIIHDKGFGSTSVDPSVWSGNHHIQLHVPKESNVVLPGAYTTTNESHEKEVTLPRNHQIRVVSVHEPGDDTLEGDPHGWKWETGAKRLKGELVVPGLNDDATLAKAKAESKKKAD